MSKMIPPERSLLLYSLEKCSYYFVRLQEIGIVHPVLKETFILALISSLSHSDAMPPLENEFKYSFFFYKNESATISMSIPKVRKILIEEDFESLEDIPWNLDPGSFPKGRVVG